MKKYDYVIVGGGLFAGTFAYFAKKAGKTCLIVEKRETLGGNLYCEDIEGIHVHKYGAHIFHTSNRKVWDFVNSLVEFNRYTNSPVANYKGEIYNMPFNMNTFSKMWGIATPKEAEEIINRQKAAVKGEPKNLEEQAISLVGEDIYKKLIKGYTEKQWGRDCKDLPAFIIKRLPVRYTYDNNYFNDLYQGIPIMASCALPVMCRPVEINGRYYFDGGVSDSLPVKKMIKDGCTKIVALFSKPDGFLMKPQGHRRIYTAALSRRFPNTVEALNHRHEQYNRSMKRIRRMEQEGRALTFAPSGEIRIKTSTRDPAVMQQLYDNGVRDARERMKELKDFLQK